MSDQTMISKTPSLDWGQAEKAKDSGCYIPWITPGTVVAGRVRKYSPDGGTAFGGEPVPFLQLELVEPAYYVAEDGSRVHYAIGTEVLVNCSQARLQIRIKDLESRQGIEQGDFIRIEYLGMAAIPGGKTAKDFDVRLIPGNGPRGRQPSVSYDELAGE